MTSLGLGDIAAFPFVEAPDNRNIQDGVRLLEELGAIKTAENGHYQLTPQGRQLAQLPIDHVWRGWCWKPRRVAACAR